jgi:redox-sensitive bicupin YhaK (pirin superfamily)
LDEIIIEASKDNTRIALIGGEQMGQRFIDWNFVSSRKERIEQAKADWQAQKFDSIPEDNQEYIPLPD